MDWLSWYVQGLRDLWASGWAGQLSEEEYVLLFGCAFVLLVVFPFWMYQNKYGQQKIWGVVRKLAEDLGGHSALSERSPLGIDELKSGVYGYPIGFRLKGEECQVVLYAFPISILTRISNLVHDAPWSTVFRLKLPFDTGLWFSVRLEGPNKFSLPSLFRRVVRADERDIVIENRDAFSRIVDYQDLMRLLETIDFNFRPQFRMDFDGNSFEMRVGKTENTIDDVRKYLDLMEKVIDSCKSLRNL
jgi:hypothetical protein